MSHVCTIKYGERTQPDFQVLGIRCIVQGQRISVICKRGSTDRPEEGLCSVPQEEEEEEEDVEEDEEQEEEA